MKNIWIEEKLYANLDSSLGYKQSLVCTEVLFSNTSNFQRVEIFTNPKFGKVLMLDGVIQTTLSDEFFYHEMLAHVPLYSLHNAKKVLIIGGGDGGILREVLKHNIDLCYMVEIDGMVIDACTQHMPEINNGAFLDPRARVLVADGIQFVKDTVEKFDVIIVDSTDPNPSSAVLFTKDFYNNAKKLLNKGGVLVTQSGVPFFQPQELKEIQSLLGSVFKTVKFFTVPVPTYVGGFMCLSFAMDDGEYLITTLDELNEKFTKESANLKYYNSNIHIASFALPNYIKKLL